MKRKKNNRKEIRKKQDKLKIVGTKQSNKKN